jgi:hypothetical protein
MEEKLRQKDTVIEKLRLKNTTTKAYIAKMEQQLAHKEEMGEVLHLVGVAVDLLGSPRSGMHEDVGSVQTVQPTAKEANQTYCCLLLESMF